MYARVERKKSTIKKRGEKKRNEQNGIEKGRKCILRRRKKFRDVEVGI
jgi:hypothetical protein